MHAQFRLYKRPNIGKSRGTGHMRVVAKVWSGLQLSSGCGCPSGTMQMPQK